MRFEWGVGESTAQCRSQNLNWRASTASWGDVSTTRRTSAARLRRTLSSPEISRRRSSFTRSARSPLALISIRRKRSRSRNCCADFLLVSRACTSSSGVISTARFRRLLRPSLPAQSSGACPLPLSPSKACAASAVSTGAACVCASLTWGLDGDPTEEQDDTDVCRPPTAVAVSTMQSAYIAMRGKPRARSAQCNSGALTLELNAKTIHTGKLAARQPCQTRPACQPCPLQSCARAENSATQTDRMSPSTLLISDFLTEGQFPSPASTSMSAHNTPTHNIVNFPCDAAFRALKHSRPENQKNYIMCNKAVVQEPLSLDRYANKTRFSVLICLRVLERSPRR